MACLAFMSQCIGMKNKQDQSVQVLGIQDPNGKEDIKLIKTRSSSACHVGPLALERLIIFEQF